MKAPIKALIAALTATALSCVIVGCSSGGDTSDQENNSTEAIETTENTTSDNASAESNDTDASGYVECDGEKMTLADWAQMILSNPLSMDNYIGKEITVVADFQMFSSSASPYYTNYEQSTTGNMTYYESPLGFIVLSGSIYVDVPENDRELVSGLKPGDKVKVQGTVSGFYSGMTLLFTPASGEDTAGDITIEKVS